MAEEITTIPKKYVVSQSSQPTSPFEGMYWIDIDNYVTYQYKNGSWEKVGQDLSPLREKDLKLINDIAKNSYENTLAQNNYDNVLFDVFANSNKISSSTDVVKTLGTNGKIELGIALIDGFEDGNITEWTGDTGSFSAQTGTIISGSYTGQLVSSNTSNSVTLDFTDFSSSFKLKVRSNSQSSNTGDRLHFYIYNAAGSMMLHISFTDNGSVSELYSSTQILSSWSANTTYTIKMNPDFTNDKFDVYVNGTLEASNVPFYNSSSSFGKIEYGNDTASSGSTRNGWIDDLKGGGYVSSGSFTSVHKVLGYTPSKLMIIDEQTLNGEDIEFEVYNSSGTKVKTITQSDLNSEVSLDVTDTEFYIKGLLSQSGGNTPELLEYGILFV